MGTRRTLSHPATTTRMRAPVTRIRAPRAPGLAVARLVSAAALVAALARCTEGTGGLDAGALDPPDGDPPVTAPDDAGLRCASLGDGMGDRAALSVIPDWYDRIARWGRPSAQGLTGRNATWGAMLDPREQIPAALLARASLVHAQPGDAADAAGALRALEATLALVDATTGRLPLTPPPGANAGSAALESESDEATLAFLGEACAALDALARSPRAAAWSLASRVGPLRPRVGYALDAYAFRVEALSVRDGFTARDPERLLSTARFFAACGRFTLRSASFAPRAARFTREALALQRADGAFLFSPAARPDVYFQARALVSVHDLAALGSEGSCDAALTSLRKGSAWLAAQIDSGGRTRATERSRACGAETRLGAPVAVEPDLLVRALAYAGSATEQPAVTSAARRVYERARAYAPGYAGCE